MGGDGELLGLRDVVTLITGAGSGLGRATALLYGQAGAQVACCDLNEASAAETAAEIESAGGRALAQAVDVRDPASVRAMVAAVERRLGPLEVAVNVAGGLAGSGPKPFMDMSLEDWEAPLRLNLTGSMLCCQAEGIAMARSGTKGRIVNFASISGVTGAPTMAHYGAAKAGLMHLTKTLSLEFSDYGIRVNCVAPGFHWTPAVERRAKDPASGGQFMEFAERVKQQTPLGRGGEPWETAGVALFLGSRLSSYVTGQTLASDGGVVNTNARGAVWAGMKPKALEDDPATGRE